MPVSVLTNVIDGAGLLVAGAASWAGSFVGMVTETGNELLLVFVLVPLIGVGVGLVKKMIG